MMHRVFTQSFERRQKENHMKKSAAIAATKRAALIECAVRMLPSRDLQHLKNLVGESPDPLVEMTVCGRCHDVVARTRSIYRQLHAEIYP